LIVICCNSEWNGAERSEMKNLMAFRFFPLVEMTAICVFAKPNQIQSFRQNGEIYYFYFYFCL